MTDQFATLLQRARRTMRDPHRGGLVTQECFAELIGAYSTTPGYPTSQTISNWERGVARPRGHDRAAMHAVITVLFRYGGLASKEEADTLLKRGGYAPLTDEEVELLRRARPVASEIVRAGARSEETPTQTTTRGDRQQELQTLIAVRHQSMERIPDRAITSALSEAQRGWQIEEIVIDQCDLFREGRLTDPRAAAHRQHDLEQQIQAALAIYPTAQLAYYGIAHIPLTMLAGYTLSNRRAIQLFEYHRYEYTWDLLHRGGAAPALRVTGIPEQTVWDRGEVAVCISLSFQIHARDVADVLPDMLGSVNLGLETPMLDSITSIAQLRSYAQAFRNVMDAVHERFPRASAIHLFYAGPPSLAFLCGQCLSKTLHPRVIVYNYAGKDTPKYAWGIEITGDLQSDTFVVRPLGH